MIEEFQRDGVVVLRGVFRGWIGALAAGVTEVMKHPSALERLTGPGTDLPRFSSTILQLDISPDPEVSRFMQSNEARHDHVLVKPPGNTTVTPWHQDQPYYCVAGAQSVSFWTPLDPVSRGVTLECVAGSHRWHAAGYRPKRFDGTPLYANDDFEEVPDIDAQKEQLTIRGWAMEAGDAVAFDFRTIHGAPANTATRTRRVFSSRWVGADARFVRRGTAGSPPFAHLTLADGAPFDAPDFPLVYRRQSV